MALTATNIIQINKMNRASQNAQLGTVVAGLETAVGDLEDGSIVVAGVHAVTAGEETAGTLDIDTGLATATVMIVQIYRAGVPIFSDQAVSMAAGVITVADGAATYSVTEADAIMWMVA